MSIYRDYIPQGDIAFGKLAEKVIEYAEQNYERWRTKAPSAELKDTFEAFQAALLKSRHPNSGNIDKYEKNEIKEKLEKLLRNYIQGNIARNEDVTSADRVSMYLPAHNRTPAPVPVPTGQAVVSIAYPGRTQLLLVIRPVASMLNDPRANYGWRIHYRVCAHDETPPASGKDLHDCKFTRRKKELITFDPSDSGKIAYFCIRYENRKGNAGPWGPMVWAVIP